MTGGRSQVKRNELRMDSGNATIEPTPTAEHLVRRTGYVTGAGARLVADGGRLVILVIVSAIMLAFFASGVSQLAIEARAQEDLSLDTIFPSLSEIRSAWNQHERDTIGMEPAPGPPATRAHP